MRDIPQRLCQFGIDLFGDKRGWKTRFAEALGISTGAMQMYLTGQRRPGNELHEKLRILGCDIEWLMTGIKGGINMTLEAVSIIKIPVYDFNKIKEWEMTTKNKASDYIYTQKTDDETLFALIVKGNNMAPEINEGNIIVISQKQEHKNGDICLIVFRDDHAALYRVYENAGKITFTSIDEKQYPPSTHKKSEIKFIYKVVQKITNY